MISGETEVVEAMTLELLLRLLESQIDGRALHELHDLPTRTRVELAYSVMKFPVPL